MPGSKRQWLLYNVCTDIHADTDTARATGGESFFVCV
jgi:hypothetical protein